LALMLPNGDRPNITARDHRLARRLDQPGVENVVHPLREAGLISSDDLTQACVGDGELELGALVD
jgi:hypothetical protein